MKVWLLLLASALLAGCMSSEEFEAAQAAEDEAYCTEAGFEPGSADHEACRIQLSDDRDLEQYTRATDRTRYGNATRYGLGADSSAAWRRGSDDWPYTW
jgi:hypothetical protein